MDSDYLTRASTDGTEFNAGAVLRDDNDDNDDGQKLEESEASLAFMELDIS